MMLLHPACLVPRTTCHYSGRKETKNKCGSADEGCGLRRNTFWILLLEICTFLQGGFLMINEF